MAAARAAARGSAEVILTKAGDAQVSLLDEKS